MEPLRAPCMAKVAFGLRNLVGVVREGIVHAAAVQVEVFAVVLHGDARALDADLNTSLAITTLYDVLKADMNDATKLALLDNFDQVLGLALLSHAEAKRKEAAKTTSASTASGYQITGEGDPEIDALVLKRYEAKKAKNFAEADKIRDDLKAQGIEVADVRGGAVWKRI